MVRRTLSTLALLTAGLVVPLSHGAPAYAAPRVDVANSSGQAVVDPTYATTVTVKGRGFQSVKNGFGGVYVGFGTVKGTWQPSKGGKTGVSYWYVPDTEDKANQGLFKFVAFPGSETSTTSNGGVVKADGTWRTTLVIPGDSFQAHDRDGNATTIDCRKVTCGIITFGAHGVANGANESFTPIRFADLTKARPAASASAGVPTSSRATVAPTPAAGITAVGQAEAPAAAAPGAAPKLALTVDRATAVVGRVLTFTATGVTPGEQVAVSLDDGLAAVGPLGAGSRGEVAGVLQLPLDLSAGTHVLKLTGAASGAQTTVSFAVVAAPESLRTASQDESDQARAPFVFLVICLLVLVGTASTLAFVRIRRRRSSARAAA